MLKYILMATTMAVAVPAYAQDSKTKDSTATEQPAPPDTATPVEDASAQPAPAEPQAKPAESQAQAEPTTQAEPVEGQQAATQPTPPTPAQPATATAAQPATPATPAQPATATAAQPATPATPAQPATATAQQPAANANQVAQVVSKEFSVYDKDSSGSLDQTEFGAWMSALRKASEPGFQPNSATASTWIGQAFAQADADKNKSVNQGELTTFLTPKAS